MSKTKRKLNKTGLSPAEQSRLASQAALDRQATEKQRKEKEREQFSKELAEKHRREEEECKLQAVPVGEQLYSLLRARIKQEEEKGGQKLQTTFYSILSGLTHPGQKSLAGHALNHAAKKLRDDGYGVRFGRSWSREYFTDPYNSNITDHDSGFSWGQDATNVPRYSDWGSKKFQEASSFTSLEIEITWGKVKEG